MLAWLSGVRCRLAYGPADATATHCFLVLAHPGSPGKGPLNGCMCVLLSYCSIRCYCVQFLCRCIIQVMLCLFINTVNDCRFWGTTLNTQLYHGVLLLANVLLSAFIQLCQVEFISKFLRHTTSYSNVLEHSGLHPTCLHTVLACFHYLVMLQ